MAYRISPGVSVTEKDFSLIVPATSTTSAGFVGAFQWGPVGEPIRVDSTNNMVQVFGEPNDDTYEWFLTAESFLSYGNNLNIVRVVETSALNAVANGAGLQIKNFDDYESKVDANAAKLFAAKYPGVLGNSLDVIIIDGSFAGSSLNITYGNNTVDVFDLFSEVPDTSNDAATRANAFAADEIHVAIIDSNGEWSGVKGEVLEVFPFVSKAGDAKRDNGSSNYYKDVLNNESQYIWWLGHPEKGGDGSSSSSGAGYTSDWGRALAELGDDVFDTLGDASGLGVGVYRGQLTNGADGNSISDTELQEGWGLFEDAQTTDVTLLVTGPAPVATQQWVIDNIAEVRKDAVAFVSPMKEDVVGVTNLTTQASNVIEWVTDELNRSSSYAVADSGWKLMFNRFQDKNVWVPLNGDVAGLCARTDEVADPWFSPAGLNRGQVKNSIKLAFNPRESHRDDLYKNSINPIVQFPGQGTVLFGDKTMLDRPSAFDRINVRRLFIAVEKSIAEFSRFVLFEPNDAFTRNQFRSSVEPFLRDVQGRRGITSFLVVCDETNNTPEVVARNEFVASILIKPSFSINFITLNFVATRSDISFTEVAS